MTPEERSKFFSEYKASLKEKTLEELEKMEEEIIKVSEETDKELAEAKFSLPTKNYKEVAEAIRYFLNKQSVQWQYTLGMVTMYEFWNPEKKPKDVPYPTFDQSLRSLGNLQFEGYDEWKKVLLINDYFQCNHEKYATLTDKIYSNAEKHTYIVDEMNLRKPIEPVEQQINE